MNTRPTPLTKPGRRFLLLSLLLALLLSLSACGDSAGASGTAAIDSASLSATPTPSGEQLTATAEAALRLTEQASWPDLRGNTISIYMIGDASSEYAQFSTLPLIEAAQEMVAAINRDGGVFGARLAMQLLDSEGVLGKAVADYESLLEDGAEISLLILHGVDVVDALYARAAEDQVPVLATYPSHQALYAPESGYVFSLMPTFEEQFAYFLDYLAANWQTVKPANAGDEIKIAYISWPDAFGQAAYTPQIQAYAEQVGVQLVAAESFDYAIAAETATALLDALVAGANVIYTNTYAFGTADLLNDLENFGLRENFVVAGPFYAIDQPLSDFLADPSYADGFLAPFPSAWWSETDNPAIQFALQNLEDAELGPESQSIARLLMLGSIDLVRHALQQAILEIGFANLDAQAVYQALTNVEGYQVLDGLMSVDFTGGRRSPYQLQLRMVDGDDHSPIILQDFAPVPELPAIE